MIRAVATLFVVAAAGLLLAAHLFVAPVQQRVIPTLPPEVQLSAPSEPAAIPDTPLPSVLPSLPPQPLRCDAGAALATPPRIVYSVLTGGSMHDTRVATLVQRTWARHIDRSSSIVFFSDADDPSIPTIKLSPPEGEEQLTTGAWRNLPALRYLHDHRPRFGCFDWVFFVDDDAYVFPRTLEKRLAAEAAARGGAPTAEYLGVYHTPRVDLEWKDPRAHISCAAPLAAQFFRRAIFSSAQFSRTLLRTPRSYAHGGAGYLLSWPMLQKMRPKIDGCHEAYTGWAGDLRVGKCVSVAIGQSSTVRDFRGLHTEQPDHYAWVDAAFVEQAKGLRYHTSAERFAPISFHHLSAETAATLDKMHLVVDTDARGRVWQYDFSDVSFGEHRFSPAGSREELRLLFGFHVDAREPNAPPLSANSAHSGWRTLYDNLRSFRRVGSSFEMELGVTPPVDTRINARVKPTYPFPRDTCPDHRPGEVRLKRALVKVRCGAPCGSGGSDATAGGGAVCSARYEGCDLVIDLALRRCPPPTLRTFRGLSVGTTAGGSDVVRDGAPVGAWAAGATVAQHRGGADGWVALGVHSELPVWVGRPRATVEPAGAAVAVELAGTLVGPANHSRVAADADASLLVRARCRPGAATGRAVVHVHAPVERGGYEALRFSLAKVCGMSRRVVGGRATQ